MTCSMLLNVSCFCADIKADTLAHQLAAFVPACLLKEPKLRVQTDPRLIADTIAMTFRICFTFGILTCVYNW